MGTDYRGDVNHGDAGRNKNEPLWKMLDLEGRTLKNVLLGIPNHNSTLQRCGIRTKGSSNKNQAAWTN
jgi:hypothetical protein